MKLPKEKRDHLILVTVVTAILLAGIWFGLISRQRQKLADLARKKDAAVQKIGDEDKAIHNSRELESDLAAASEKLAALEQNMASGDLNLWFFTTIRQFKTNYNVDIPNISAGTAANNNMFGRFPYRQVTVSVAGSGFYHDIGKFIADLENHFPQMRVQNLILEPQPGTTPADVEKLSFKMEIVALIKSGAT